MFSREASAERKITGIFSYPRIARSRRMNSHPSITGIMMSQMTISGSPRTACCNPSRPLLPVKHSHPGSSTDRIRSMMSSSSSMMSTRIGSMCLPSCRRLPGTRAPGQSAKNFFRALKSDLFSPRFPAGAT